MHCESNQMDSWNVEKFIMISSPNIESTFLIDCNCDSTDCLKVHSKNRVELMRTKLIEALTALWDAESQILPIGKELDEHRITK